MTLLGTLDQLYRKCEEEGLVDKQDEAVTLLPLYHSSMRSDGKNIVRATITKEGELVSADYLPDSEIIVFPVTAESMARTSAPQAHPLVDKMAYSFGDEKKRNLYCLAFEDYLAYERSIGEGAFLSSIANYLSQATFDELVRHVLKTSDYTRDKLTVTLPENEQSKKKTVAFDNVFLTFEVINFDNAKNLSVTNAVRLHERYAHYYESKLEGKGICALSGEEDAITNVHRGVLGTAKLISVSNHTETYKGRFSEKTDVAHIGQRTTERAHQMLTYLLKNLDSSVYMGGSARLINWFSGDVMNKSEFELPIGRRSLFMEIEESDYRPTDHETKEIAKSFLRGEQYFEASEDYNLLLIDQPAPGRVAAKGFYRIPVSELFQNLSAWTHRYSRPRFSFTERVIKERTPHLRTMMLAAYGVEQNGRLEINKESFSKDQYQKLIFAMIEGREVPKNIREALKHNIRMRSHYDKTWTLVVETALSVLQHEIKGGEKTMLDNKETDRSYLFGRLLAVYREMEASVRRQDGAKDFTTNAERYWAQYLNSPARMMVVLRNRAEPYRVRLSKLGLGGLRVRYEKAESEILRMLNDSHDLSPMTFNKPLDYRFIFGYEAQREEFFTKKEKTQETSESDAENA